MVLEDLGGDGIHGILSANYCNRIIIWFGGCVRLIVLGRKKWNTNEIEEKEGETLLSRG